MKLNAAALGRTAAIVWQWRNVYDFCYFDTCAVYGTNGALTTVARTLYECFHLTQAKLESCLGAILCGPLSCIGSILL